MFYLKISTYHTILIPKIDVNQKFFFTNDILYKVTIFVIHKILSVNTEVKN